MTEDHPNLVLLNRLNPADLASCTDLFAEDVVFHYFNPNIPDLQGDYVGLAGIRRFFEAVHAMTDGTFKVEPVSATAAGDELVVVQTRNTLTFKGQPITVDVVVVWRFVDGLITEVWDIPSAYSMATTG